MFSNERRQEVERDIVRATVEAALKLGFTLHSVNNGEEEPLVSTVDEVMEYAFSCDEAHIFFREPGMPVYSWLYIVLGNEGWTVISDYTVDLDGAVQATEALVEKYEAEDAGA
jgi:hypothetical protein